jgi:UDP:flavonoid glycosyltransferase YjiC (YdhE family)
MKILFSVRPAYGHVYPLMPLALAARDAGHHVRFATTGRFLNVLRGLGFATDDVGVTLEDARDQLLASVAATEMPRASDGRPDVEMGARMFLEVVAPRTAADLGPLLSRFEPDVVVYEQYDVGAAVAAHGAGITAVCHSVSPRLPDEVVGLIAGNHLDRLWATQGGDRQSLDVFTGDVYLDIFPTCLQQPSFLDDPARVTQRPVPFVEPGALLPEWVNRRDRPLVYLTLGTVVSTDEVLRPVAEGLGALDVDVLLALGSAAGTTLGPLPPNVHVEAFVDQPAVLRHADLAVHHGGSGTMLGALIHGTPQVLVPKGADQFWNADLMARAGLAAVLEPSHVTSDAVGLAAAAELADDRPSVALVRQEIAAMPDPSEVLEELATRIGWRSGAPSA